MSLFDRLSQLDTEELRDIKTEAEIKHQLEQQMPQKVGRPGFKALLQDLQMRDEVIEADTDDLIARLKAIGDATGINPPQPPEPNVDYTSYVTPPATPSAEKSQEVCPYCKKSFKYLSKHKCKLAPTYEKQEPVQSSPVQGPSLPTHKPWVPDRDSMPLEDRAQYDGDTYLYDAVQAQLAPAPPTIGNVIGSMGNVLSEAMAPTSDPMPEQMPSLDKFNKCWKALADECKAAKEDMDETGFVLLLDAIFEKLPLQHLHHFSDIVAPLAGQVAKENQVEHWGIVSYAQGGPQLAAKLEKWFDNVRPLGGYVIADSHTAEVKACKDVLKRNAKIVIQGIR